MFNYPTDSFNILFILELVLNCHCGLSVALNRINHKLACISDINNYVIVSNLTTKLLLKLLFSKITISYILNIQDYSVMLNISINVKYEYRWTYPTSFDMCTSKMERKFFGKCRTVPRRAYPSL